MNTVRIEGAILPPDFLERIRGRDERLGGFSPADYHRVGRERIEDAILRAWNRLLGAWTAFDAQAGKLPEGDAGTSLTRERWLLVLFHELGYGRLPVAKAIEVKGRSYPISHQSGDCPIHLVSLRQRLDQRSPGVRGAARVSPHSLLQELLNRSDSHLWGFVSNGLRLRLLRDNVSLSRAAFIEFDLEAMMRGDIYADFVLLWLLAHQSRVQGGDGKGQADCWLERWFRVAREEGTRVRDQLRDGVELAIETLGRGFLTHGANRRLRERIEKGEMDERGYYQQLLRLVYRLLFLFVAEDRDLLARPGAPAEVRETYRRHYSTRRLRRLAAGVRGSAHGDHYRGLQVVLERLRGAGEALGLPALGGMLFSPDAAPDLDCAEISNADFLTAVRHLSSMADGHGRRPVDYRNLGAEELGSVYESLLEQHPAILRPRAKGDRVSDGEGAGAGKGAARRRDAGAGTPGAATTDYGFELSVAAGSERKTTGSYYTPDSLIQCLLDSALDPVLDEAVRGSDARGAEGKILALKVCDPACGSGHFLVAAARRMAKRLAAVRTDEEEPAPEALREALRDVIGRCIYGVDLNPMAVELCRINLWMEALVPGKPLSFLDHHIQCGNSLLGATPALIAAGIPDEAFSPIEGDDKKVCSSLRRESRVAQDGSVQGLMFVAEVPKPAEDLSSEFIALDREGDETPAAYAEKARRYQAAVGSAAYQRARLTADAWCAAFVWRKDGRAIGTGPSSVLGMTNQLLRRIEAAPERVPVAVRDEIVRLREQYGFFHWHLAFPEVFRVSGAGEEAEHQAAGWSGGFDVVLGNPPWEHTELKEREWFATRSPEIAKAPTGAARKRMIESLATTDASLFQAFCQARRAHDGVGHFVGSSGRYPLCGRGRINTYAVFAELMRGLTGARGRTGAIIPSGIATDDTTKFFFQDLMERRSLVSLYDFENRERIFPAVDSRVKFCLLTLSGRGRPAEAGAEFVFFAHRVEDLAEEERRILLTAEDLALINPNTRTCPIFRTRTDAELTKYIYRRVPVLIKEGPPEENPWGIRTRRVFNMGIAEVVDLCVNSDEHRADAAYLPMYEAKLVHQFDHRWGTYEATGVRELAVSDKSDPGASVCPRFWIDRLAVDEKLAQLWSRNWLLCWRDICRSTDERTVIGAIIPRAGTDFTLRIGFVSDGLANRVPLLLANLNSFVLDYCARNALGGTHLSDYIVAQLPALPPSLYAACAPWCSGGLIGDWIARRVVELVNTSKDVAAFACDCGCGGRPSRWDEERRFKLRCELDAAFFRLYLGAEGQWRDSAAPELAACLPTPTAAASYIMDTFPIVRRNEERRWGRYRSKEAILDLMERGSEAPR